MRSAIITLVLLTTGCVGSKYYYHISSQEHWRSYGSACTGPIGTYEKDLGDRARVLLMPRYDTNGTMLLLRYMVRKGSAIQLVRPVVEVQIDSSGKKIILPIEEFKSGMEWENYPKEYWVKTITYKATDELKGQGRFSNNPRPSDRDDWFDVNFHLSKDRLNWLKVALPTVRADGALIKITPVVFEYKKSHYLMCVQ